MLGTFVYTPAAGAVPAVGNGQMLSVQFTPTDTTDYNNASKNVSINALAASAATLVMPQTAARDTNTNEVVVTITVANSGGAPATAVRVTSAKIGLISTTTVLPASMPDIPAGGSSTTVVRFPGPVGPADARVVLAVIGTYSGGSFGGSARMNLP